MIGVRRLTRGVKGLGEKRDREVGPVDTDRMTMTFYDKSGMETLVEQIGQFGVTPRGC
jgi:hypothetical protein